MANDLNRFECIGRFGQDPDIAYSASGKAVANFSIAVGSEWKDKNSGQKQEATEWVRFVAFDRLAEIIGEYCRKGSKVYLSGRWRTRKWQDQSGQDRYTTEIVANELQMLDSKESSREPAAASGESRRVVDPAGAQGAGVAPPQSAQQQQFTPPPPYDDPFGMGDDSIPF